jgi:hypothetical protein
MLDSYTAAVTFAAFVLGLVVAAIITRRLRNTSSWTPEHIAYNLLGIIAKQEGKSLGGKLTGSLPDKKWLLDTFAECMEAVRDPSHRLDRSKQI